MMKSILVLFTVLLTILALSSCNSPATSYESAPVVSYEDSLSYSTGFQIGSNYRPIVEEVNIDALVRGIVDGLHSEQGLIDDATCNKQFVALSNVLREKMSAEQAKAAESSKADGLAYLEANKNKSGVQVTGSGLQYKVLTEGTGKSPEATDNCVVHYKGTLIDGTKFDSSYDRGEPATFRPNQVIKGWTEALQMMKEGSKWELVIPSELGYGDRGAGRTIPGGAVLVFEVELLEVK